MNLLEQPLPSTVSEEMRNSSRILVKNFPVTLTRGETECFLISNGPIKQLNLEYFTDGMCAEVLYENSSDALRAYERIQNYVLGGCLLQVEFPGVASEKTRKPQDAPCFSQSRFNNLPLRILVPTSFIGAIIGLEGSVIKSVTSTCKTRVDVHGRENIGLPEKVVSIYGQLENRTSSCKMILEILKEEGVYGTEEETVLKMLVHDVYCGRLIGKEGRNINKIKEDSGTRIVFSNPHELASLQPFRVVSITGSIDGVSQAESFLSAKISSIIDLDAKMNMNFMAPLLDMGAMGNVPVMFPPKNYVEACGYAFQHGTESSQQTEMCQVCIPNSAVGSMIGSGGSTIRRMMKDSMASMNVEPKPLDVEESPSLERIITIKGSLGSCWKACHMVFEKMKSHGFFGNCDAYLKTIRIVPAMYIGKVIGKHGKNIRDAQKTSGAIIRVPVDNSRHSGNNSGSESGPPPQEEVPVEVSGNFQSVQNAHLIMRALIKNCSRSHSGFQSEMQENLIPSS